MGEEPSLSGVFGLTISLAKPSGTLRIHFAQEDRHLYPSLMASGQGDIAATARRFLEEMGQLGPALNAFTEKWRDSGTIVPKRPGKRRVWQECSTPVRNRWSQNT